MNKKFGSGKLLGWLAAIVAIAAVIASIWLNPPSANRARVLDQKRLGNLAQTENAIKTYYTLHHALPADLNALDGKDNRLMQANWQDPETQRPFDYEIVDDKSYRLCAVFARPSEKGDNPYGAMARQHNAGRDCFLYTAIQP
jgi:type II secretory pathway pseudopilin PulG